MQNELSRSHLFVMDTSLLGKGPSVYLEERSWIVVLSRFFSTLRSMDCFYSFMSLSQHKTEFGMPTRFDVTERCFSVG